MSFLRRLGFSSVAVVDERARSRVPRELLGLLQEGRRHAPAAVSPFDEDLLERSLVAIKHLLDAEILPHMFPAAVGVYGVQPSAPYGGYHPVPFAGADHDAHLPVLYDLGRRPHRRRQDGRAWGVGWAGWLPVLGADRAPWSHHDPKILLPILDHAAYGIAWALLFRALSRMAG